jgi:hypothetical protein
MSAERVNEDRLRWLLETDPENPAVRYFALRDLLGRAEQEAQVRRARRAIMESGPVPAILVAQDEAGYWVKPGSGYSPKYLGTVWQIIFLAELGADPADERVRRGCEYLLEHNVAANGAFSCYRPPTPRGALHCLNGNLLEALIKLGFGDDPRLQAALEWQVRAITGDGEVEYYQSGTAGPGFACGVNLGQPCGWGAIKALKALRALPDDLRSANVQRAIDVGVEFLLGRDPALADYPYTERVSSTWFRLGFPLSYWSDVLENTSVLVELGYGGDERLAGAIQFIKEKADKHGRWKLENSLNGKMWVDIEKRGKPSKWVTLRALRVLKGVEL